MSSRLKALGTVLVAACAAHSVSITHAADLQGGALAPQAITRPDSGSFLPKHDQPLHDFGIMGQVARPAVYALPNGVVRLSELVEIAGGVTDRGGVRVMRNGRQQATVVMPGIDAELFPGDIVIFDRAPANADAATSTTNPDAVTTVGYTDESQLQPPADQDRFVQLAFIGLYDHPVIPRLPANEATLANIVSTLNQAPDVAGTIKVVQAGTQRRAPGQHPHDVQLASGSILIFDKATLALDRLPQNVPSPISCSATDIPIDSANASNDSPAAAHQLHVPPAQSATETYVPPSPIDNESLDLSPTNPPVQSHTNNQPTPLVAPSTILQDVRSTSNDPQNHHDVLPPQHEALSPNVSAPQIAAPADNAGELPQWTGNEPAPQPSAQHESVTPIETNPAANHDSHPRHNSGIQVDDLKHNAGTPQHDSSFREVAPPIPREDDFLDSSNEFSTHGRPADAVGEQSSLPAMPFDPLPPDPIHDEIPEASQHEDAASSPTLVDPSDAGTMDAPKAKSRLRIKLPGVSEFVIPTDLFIVGALGIIAAIIAVATLVPGAKDATTSVIQEVAVVLLPGIIEAPEPAAPAPAKEAETKQAPVAVAVEPKVAEPEAAEAKATRARAEDSLEALIRNSLPIVEEPYEIKSNLTFFGRPTLRLQNRIDSPHERATPHVAQHTIPTIAEKPAKAKAEARSASAIAVEESSSQDRERKTSRKSAHADLLDRALSNIQGAQIR